MPKEKPDAAYQSEEPLALDSIALTEEQRARCEAAGDRFSSST